MRKLFAVLGAALLISVAGAAGMAASVATAQAGTRPHISAQITDIVMPTKANPLHIERIATGNFAQGGQITDIVMPTKVNPLHIARIATGNYALGGTRHAPISGGGGECNVSTNITTNSGKSAITGTAYTFGCTGVADCFQRADIELFNPHDPSAGWSSTKQGPTESGCGSSHASITSKGCGNAGQAWDYRTLATYTIYWSGGGVTGPVDESSGTLSMDKIC